MARAGFYNENEYRDYPFLTQVKPLAFLIGDDPDMSSSSAVVDLPHEAIVDFGAIMGLDAGFNEATHWIYLYRVERQDPFYIYEFRTTAPGALGESLIFVRNFNTDPIHAQSWARSRTIGLPDPFPATSSVSSVSVSDDSEGDPFCVESSVSGGDCGGPGCDEPTWEGFMVAGLFADLSELLADSESFIFDSRLWVVEPTRIQNLAQAFAQSMNLANVDRTRATLPEDCISSSSSEADTDGQIYSNAICMQGDLSLKAGYNCVIRQEDAKNAILIGAAVGAGEGEPCDEIAIFAGEVPPAGSRLLTGGPTCGEIVKAINGKSARNFRIEAGPGFRITTDVGNPSKLIIDAALDDFALCLAEQSSSSGDC